MKVIRTNQKVESYVIICTWIMLVILPFVLFKTGSAIFFADQFKQNMIQAQPMLFTELQYFAEDLDEKSWLKEKLEAFDAQNNFTNFTVMPDPSIIRSFKDVSAKNLINKLQSHLGIPVLSVFSYSIDTLKADFAINQGLSSDLNLSSKTMLRRLFSVLNNQTKENAYNKTLFKSAFPISVNIYDKSVRTSYSEIFLQKLFGTPYLPNLHDKTLFETAAGKIGFAGNIIFYLSQSTFTNKEQQMNLGGYLVAIRLQDISEKSIVRYAVKNSFYKQLNRRVGKIKKKLQFPDNFANHGISSFHLLPDRYALSSIIPQVAIVRRVQKGTIFPGDFSDFKNHLPALETSIPIEKLQHPLQKHEKSLFFLENLFLLIGTALFVRLWLFGLNFKASISFKISIATIFTCLTPLAGFFALSYVYESLDESAQNENLKTFIEARTFSIRRLVNDEILSLGKKTQSLATQLEKTNDRSEKHLVPIFENWCDKNSAFSILFQEFDGSLLYVTPAKYLEQMEIKQSIDLKKVSFASLIELLQSSSLRKNQLQKGSTILTDGSNNNASAHEVIISGGKPIYAPRISRNSRMSAVMLRGKNKAPFALLAIDYSTEMMLDEIFKKSFETFKFADKLMNFEINFAIARIKPDGYEIVKNCSSPRINHNLAHWQINECSKVKKKLVVNFKDENKEYFSMVHFSPNLPYLIIAQCSKPLKSENNYPDSDIWIFPLLLLSATLLLSKIFFTDPAIKFSQGLREIASGNLNHKLLLSTNDEFEVLSHDFNLMTKSLIEKEKLEEFVSPDVIKEINRHTEAEMTPGGEKIEATILFSTFKHIAINGSGSGQINIVHEIDSFLSVCNAICSQNHGVIDKIIGKTMMMVFRGTFNHEDHHLRACNVAIQIHESMKASEKKGIICNSGLSTGTVVSGKIGSRNGKLDFTVIGDTVNMAARLKTQSEKGKTSSIICSEPIFQKVHKILNLKELSPVEIKGKKGLFKTFEIIIG